MKVSILKALISAVLIGYAAFASAQTNNVFLERAYWDKAPDKSDIDNKIKTGNDPAELNINGFDGLTYAILQNAPLESLSYMLSLEGNDANKITHDGRNYIFWAAYKSNVPFMKVLMKNKSRLDIVDTHGNSPLTFAAANGVTNTKVYDFLIEKGADMNFTDRDGANALLLIAPHDEDMKMVKYFESKGLDINSKDKLGNSAFNYAAKTGNINMMNQLIAAKVNYQGLNKEGGNAMLFAASGARGVTNDLSVFTYLQSKGVKPDAVTVGGTTPLHLLASKSDDIMVYEYFIKNGSDVNKIDGSGNNALMYAAANRNLDIVKLLGDQTDDVNISNKEGETALNNALNRNTYEVVEYLLSIKANLNDYSAKAFVSGFNEADMENFQMKYKYISTGGFQPSKAYAGGNTMMHYGAEMNEPALMKLLVEMGVDVNDVNDEGYTPLMIAAMKAKDDKVLRFLTSKGANVKAKTEFGESAFDLARENEALQNKKVDLSFLKK